MTNFLLYLLATCSLAKFSGATNLHMSEANDFLNCDGNWVRNGSKFDCQTKNFVTMSMKKCSCGSNIRARMKIVGGKDVQKHEYPWQVALVAEYSGVFCGGSLINNLYVLTAAHCFRLATADYTKITTETDPETVVLHLGAHSLRSTSSGKFSQVTRKIGNLIIHEFWNPFNFYADIALIRLDKPIERFTFHIQPLCLPPLHFGFAHSTATVTGWGITGTNEDSVDILQKTEVQVLLDDLCEERLSAYPAFFDTKIMMCAARPNHGSCQGDSGGPLTTELKPRKFYQIGIVSFGIKCGQYKYPGVYTRVNKFVDWILRNTQDALYCDE